MKHLSIFTVVMLLALVAVWTISMNLTDVSGQDEGTWQVETSLTQKDMKAFVQSLDESCDIDIEPQGVSNYIVAYRCTA